MLYFACLNSQRSVYVFEYMVTFLEFNFSNSIYIATELGYLLIILILFSSGYTDNIFLILLWCPRRLNNERIYIPVVVKMQIFNEFIYLFIYLFFL